jgi:5-methylcytosine-specific restriction endonuclease McrA
MAKAKSDISNNAIRIFLQKVGKFYDTARNQTPFGPTKDQKRELLDFFSNKCCYCGMAIDEASLSQDHLVPLNKANLGLHAWGNVVPCCIDCNNKKRQKSWQEYLESIAKGKELSSRKAKIQSFVKTKKYDPKLDLHGIANNLYEDVGEVAMTLIDLRYKQAQDEINKAVASEI